MCMNINDYKHDLQKYCNENNLSYEKVMTAVKGCGSNDILFQIPNKKHSEDGLLNETPMPTVLVLRKTEKGVEFEQTEHTAKYLT